MVNKVEVKIKNTQISMNNHMKSSADHKFVCVCVCLNEIKETYSKQRNHLMLYTTRFTNCIYYCLSQVTVMVDY